MGLPEEAAAHGVALAAGAPPGAALAWAPDICARGTCVPELRPVAPPVHRHWAQPLQLEMQAPVYLAPAPMHRQWVQPVEMRAPVYLAPAAFLSREARSGPDPGFRPEKGGLGQKRPSSPVLRRGLPNPSWATYGNPATLTRSWTKPCCCRLQLERALSKHQPPALQQAWT